MLSNLLRVDINMGCPDKNVVSCGSGAGLIKAVETAQQVSELVLLFDSPRRSFSLVSMLERVHFRLV